MNPGDLKSKGDLNWSTMSRGGISSPLYVMEQLPYQLFTTRFVSQLSRGEL